MERQFKIGASPSDTLDLNSCISDNVFTFPVKPDATPEEVRAVVEDDQGGQIFSQAVRLTLSFLLFEVFSDIFYQLMNSNRYGESRAAYREVQERHEDIKRIERTIAELAQLFNDVRFFCGHYVVGYLALP
jgi:Syntaxin